MLKLALFVVFVAFMASAHAGSNCLPTVSCTNGNETMFCIVAGSSDHTSLAGIVTGLSAPEPCNSIRGALQAANYTLLAPNNAAVAATNITGQNVTQLLQYHVIAANVQSSAIPFDTAVASAQGSTLRFNTYSAPLANTGVLVNCLSNVDAADLNTENDAVVHSIAGRLLIPTPTIAALLTSLNGTGDNDFGILLDLAVKFNLVNALEGLAAGTVFAPTNKAFRDAFNPLLGAGWEDNLNNFPSFLDTWTTNTILYHVIGTTYCAGAFNVPNLSASVPTLYANNNVTVVTDGSNAISVRDNLGNNVAVAVADVVVSQGVVHGIGAVLLPSAPPSDPSSATSLSLSVAVLAVLALASVLMM